MYDDRLGCLTDVGAEVLYRRPTPIHKAKRVSLAAPDTVYVYTRSTLVQGKVRYRPWPSMYTSRPGVAMHQSCVPPNAVGMSWLRQLLCTRCWTLCATVLYTCYAVLSAALVCSCCGAMWLFMTFATTITVESYIVTAHLFNRQAASQSEYQHCIHTVSQPYCICTRTCVSYF